MCDTVSESAQAGGGELVQRVPAHLVSGNIKDYQGKFQWILLSARNLGLVMHLDCFKCNHHQWKLSNKLHEPNDFYCLKKYTSKYFHYILTFCLLHWGWLGRRPSCLRGWGMETGDGPGQGQEPRPHWPHPDIIMTMTIYNELNPLRCNSTNLCEKKNQINF